MAKSRSYTPSVPVSIIRGNVTHAGTYRSEHQGITVEYEGRTKFAVLHASPAETLTKIMLRELVDESEGSNRIR